MSSFLRTFTFTLLVLLLVLLTFIAGYLFQQRQFSVRPHTLLDEAENILVNHGLKHPPANPALEYGMIRGMLQAYDDPYTSFVEPPQHELQSNQLEGKFGGIGVHLRVDAQGYWVLFPFEDSPAGKAGIQDSDRLLGIEGMTITPQTPVDDITSSIRGPVGQKVTLTIGHAPEFEPVEVTITREEILLPSVTWHIDPDKLTIGVIKVNIMAASTPGEIERAVENLQARGAKAFILDLRDNPGGYLTAGVDIARLFLEDGVVMQQQYRDKDVETFNVEKPGSLVDLPLAILINQGSASAAEIAAGALQAHQRAPLVGVSSFGKDTVQLVFSLDDGSSLRVTAAKWWIPDLEPPLKEIGLQPDIRVDPAESEPGGDPILAAAIQYLLGGE